MSDHVGVRAMFHRIKEFFHRTPAIAEPLKVEALEIIEAIESPEGKPDRDLSECLEFIQNLLRSGRYEVNEFMFVIECLEYLEEAESALLSVNEVKAHG